MASFTSQESDHKSTVSYHTDAPGVSMTRAKFVRAQPLDCSVDSPGPAAYYDKKEVQQSPLRQGIKFSLAKKPPGMFDIPNIQLCPGPGAYDSTGEKKLGVAEFRSVRSIVNSSGAVAVTTPHKPAIPSQFPTSATRRPVVSNQAPRSPRSVRSTSRDTSMSGFYPPSLEKASSLSNVSFGDMSTVQGDLRTDDSGSVSRQVERSQPQDFGVDPRIIHPEVWAKIRSRLTAASYTTRGQNRPALFANSDKNHDGFLDLAEVKSMFRRVLKFPQDELSDKALRHLFMALDTNRKGKLDFDHFFAFLNDNHQEQQGENTSFSESSSSKLALVKKMARPLSSPQKASQQPRMKQSRQESPHTHNEEPAVEQASSSQEKEKLKLPGALTKVLTNVERLGADFDDQLEELGEIGKVIDRLITTMSPGTLAE